MSIFVVAIHTSPLIEDNHNIYSLLIRCAVPFFFMSVGFLLENKLSSSNNQDVVLKDYIKK